MDSMAFNMSEIRKRIDKEISNYGVCLMNNTKWREVLQIIGDLHISVQFAFVRDEEFKMQIKIPKEGCKEKSTTDCTIHGPILYKDIYAIKCPQYEVKHDLSTGRAYNDDYMFNSLISKLKEVGRLPIEAKEGCIIIKGYQ